MNRIEFIETVKSRAAQRYRLLEEKGRAYSGDVDAFFNFKKNAEKLGLTKYQIWAVYCGKHLDAIFGAIKRDPNYPVDRSEGMEGRIDDAINYLDLLYGLLQEHERPVIHMTAPMTNQEVAKHVHTLSMGVGISSNESVAMIKEFLDNFYGPRTFSL